jgi:hypothetical protein
MKYPLSSIFPTRLTFDQWAIENANYFINFKQPSLGIKARGSGFLEHIENNKH